MALRGGAATPVTAKFDYVRVKPSPIAACTANGTVEAGFARLWNGLDFANTTQAGPGGFDVVNDGAEGCRLQSKGGLGLLWFNAKTYDNFTLRLQWKSTKATDNSGVFVRFPNPGTNQQLPIDQGHEIQIREGVAGDGEDQKTGSVYGIDRENSRNARPVGEWNDYEIKFLNGTYTITLNGTVVNTYTNTSTKGTRRATSASRTTVSATTLVPQRPRPGVGRGDEHLHHDRHHAGQHPRQRADPRRLVLHRRGDAAVGHGRRGAQRRR